ncbi:MAG TPA: response regulator transcription factor, partial [Nitriliruptorales bacterium]
MPVRVFILSDVRLYRDGIVDALRRETDIEIAGIATDVAGGSSSVADLAPDVVLIHTVATDAVQAVRDLVAAAPDARVIALALREDAADVMAYVVAGASGYLTLEGNVPDLVETIHDVARGEMTVSPRVAGALLRQVRQGSGSPPEPARRLTRRELEVIDLVDQGQSNKQIARRLGIEVATVKNHVHSILEKLGVSR